MATRSRQRLAELELLEGGGAGGMGGGGGGGGGIGGTRWSNLPSIRGRANTVDDLRKLTRDTSHLHGGAKGAADEAKQRAAVRTAIRGAGLAATGAGVKSMMSDDEPAKKSSSRDEVEPAENFQKNMLAEERLVKKKSSPSKNMSIEGKMYEGRNPEIDQDTREAAGGYKRGGKVASKASSRADGIAQRGKTRGKMR